MNSCGVLGTFAVRLWRPRERAGAVCRGGTLGQFGRL